MGITIYGQRPKTLIKPNWVLVSIAACHDKATLPHEQSVLLDKMLAAIKWMQDDTQLIMCPHYFTFEDVLEQANGVLAKRILLFSPQLAKQLGLETAVSVFDISRAMGKTQVAVVESLAVLSQDVKAKKAAWESMQLLMK